MKAAHMLAYFLVLTSVGQSAALVNNAKTGNPLAKVISLLDGLAAKIIKAGEEEEVAYHNFVEWCDDTTKNVQFALKTAGSQKEKLEAQIAKLTDDASAANAKIEELAGNIAAGEKDLKDATVIREKEASDFQAEETELADGIDILGRAISIIERDMAKNPALTQVDTSNLNRALKALGTVLDAASFTSADKKKLYTLMQAQQQQTGGADDEDLTFGAPAAAVYKTHSSSIVDVLEDMKEKAEEELSSLRKAEANAKHNYEMLKQSLEDQIAADNKDMDDEKASKAAAEEGKATAEGDLVQTVKELKDGEAGLAATQNDCMSVAADHEATHRARAEELKVIADAKKIITESTSGAESQAYSLFQSVSVSVSSVETRSSLRTRSDLAGAEVVSLVKKLAQEQHSEALAQLASRISAVMRYGSTGGEDPFVKVKALIEDLISKLEKQASEEAEEKAYCDDQMAKTEEKKSDLDFDIQKLTSKIDKASASSAALKQEVKELQAELAALAKTQTQLDKARAESHAAYVEAKKDLEVGLNGVRGALTLLRDYYGGAAAGASMLQSTEISDMMRQPAKPELHSKSGGAGGSIISMLEVVESDFAKTLAKEEQEESDSVNYYEKVTQENKVSSTMKTQDVKYKTQEFIALDKSISDLSSDRETANTELSAVLEYYAKIKDRCIAKPESYEERKARRTAEIKGLQEALDILEGESAFMQKGKHGHHHSHFLGFIQH